MCKCSASFVVGLAGLALGSGCIVAQAPGKGRVLHQKEPKTGAGYWVYLPEGYSDPASHAAAGSPPRKWPLVVSFHGMKPWDSSNAQIREWQQEADRYGFVVAAPDLRSSDSFGEYPMQRVTPALKRDEEAAINMLDELARTTDIDPNHVLSTSWSMGGYIAHYMANRHPDRFSCVAVRQSNFSADLLDPSKVPQYRDHKIAIYWAQKDFEACKRESQEGARWYFNHGFDVTFAEIAEMAHERTPSTAAAFFAKTCGASPKTPPVELARMQVREVPIGNEHRPSPPVTTATVLAPPPLAGTSQAPFSTAPPVTRPAGPSPLARGGSPLARSPGAEPRGSDRSNAGHVMFQPRSSPAATGASVQPSGPPPQAVAINTKPVPAPSSGKPATARPRPTVTTRVGSDPPVSVRVNTAIGPSPLLVSFSAELPEALRKDAQYLWTDNGEPIASGRAAIGQKYLTTSGDHRIEVQVTTADGREMRAGQTVTVLGRVDTRPR